MIDIEYIYKRYNQFGEYEDCDTVMNPKTMIQVYLESKHQNFDVEKRILELESENLRVTYDNPKFMLSDRFMEQPSSLFAKFNMLRIVLDSIPKSYYDKLEIDSFCIMDITVAISLYYLGLQTYKFSDLPISDVEKRNILSRNDFFIDFQTLQKIRGVTSEREWKVFLKKYSSDIYSIQTSEYSSIYMEDDKAFILCIPQFVDYIIFQTEKDFCNNSSQKERDCYRQTKGKKFEECVLMHCKKVFPEVFRKVYYNMNEKRYELDIVLRERENVAILECKSGTFETYNISSDEELFANLYNNTKKAYYQLRELNLYFENNDKYDFEHQNKHISGVCSHHIAIHVTMYSMDFISSNLHTEFEKYLDVKSPIISISYEHLFAILVDAKVNSINLWDYWRRRQEVIKEYPKMHFEANELDLYYELRDRNQDTMLNELLNNGLLKKINPRGVVMGHYHDQYGKENRPSTIMLRKLDAMCILQVLEDGKKLHGLNKRYLKNLNSFLMEQKF